MNKNDLIKELKEVHKYPDANQLGLFAGKVVQAQSYLWTKRKQMTTGVKLATSVKRICELYKKNVDEATSPPMDSSPPLVGLDDLNKDEDISWNLGKAESLWSDVLSPKKRSLPTTVVAESPGVVSVASSMQDCFWKVKHSFPSL